MENSKRGRPKLNLSEIEKQERKEKQRFYQQRYQERKIRGETLPKLTEEEKKQKKKEYSKHYYEVNKNRMLENAKKYRETYKITAAEAKKINDTVAFDSVNHITAEDMHEIYPDM
jgi:membrane protein involved in colicin uptake